MKEIYTIRLIMIVFIKHVIFYKGDEMLVLNIPIKYEKFIDNFVI
jgi:hypothetical protein